MMGCFCVIWKIEVGNGGGGSGNGGGVAAWVGGGSRERRAWVAFLVGLVSDCLF